MGEASGSERPEAAREAAVADALEAIESGLAVWDREQRLVHCNRAFKLLYTSIEEQLKPGLAFARFARLAAEANDRSLGEGPESWSAALAAAFAQGSVTEQLLADGRTLEIRHSPTASGGVTLVNEVTLAKRGERALRRAKEFAEAANNAKSRFLRAANHDLRQPLATLKILIYSCMDEESEEHRRDLLHAMDISVGIMEDLLGALLQIGQLDAGKIVPRVSTFQISQVFERLGVQFAHLAQDKGLRFRVFSPAVPVVTDKALLERILSNFVANAIRYTEVGGILIGCRRRAGKLRIEVWDSGRGIAPEQAQRIFEEFYQIDDGKRTKRGLGLGLNIAQRLAALLGHEITLRSEPGRGSVFSITLPIGDVWNSKVGDSEISEMLGGEFVGLPLLLIEDDEVLRRATKELLERWGIAVEAVGSEDEALERLAEGFEPKFAIADYSLRGKHGTDVLRKLRADDGQPLPSLIVTADTDPALIARIRQEGFPVLIKPVSPPRLRILMHALLYEPDSVAGAP